MSQMQVRLFVLVCLLPFCKLQNVKWNVLHSLNNSSLLPMAEAITHFKGEFFSRMTNSLSVVVRTSDNRNLDYFKDLLTTILTTKPKLKIKIEFSGKRKEPQSFDYYNILMTDSIDALAEIHPGWHSQHMDFSEFYLIVLHPIIKRSKLTSELKQIFDYCWQYYIINVSVLVEVDPYDIELYTYFPFSPRHCKSVVLRKINGKKSISQIPHGELFPNKFNNFFGCTLKVALFNAPPYITLPQNELGELTFGGTEGQLLNILAERLNFTVDFIIPPNNERRGLVLENGTLTGAIKLLNERLADFSLGSFRRTRQRLTVLSASTSFHQTKQVLTVLAKRENWSTYETLMYPFNMYVWCSLSMFYLIPIILAYILHQMRIRVLRFLYGVSRIKQMIFIWTSILLAQTALPLPSTNFARYILIMWILLTFILRSSYQGLLYDFFNMQKDIAPPSTLAELIQGKFELIVSRATADSLSEIKAVRDGEIKLLILDEDDLTLFAVLEAYPHRFLATSTPQDFLSYYTATNRKYGVFHVIKDEVFSQHNCIYFTKHSYLLLPMNDVIFRLEGSGIPAHWWESIAGSREVKSKVVGEKKTPLTMKQLQGIFYIQYGMWFVALLIFFLEYLLGRIYSM